MRGRFGGVSEIWSRETMPEKDGIPVKTLIPPPADAVVGRIAIAEPVRHQKIDEVVGMHPLRISGAVTSPPGK